MKKSFKIMSGVLGLSLLLGAGLFASNSVGASSAAQVMNNNLSRGTWEISVTDVKFKVGANSTQKMAEVYTTIESTAGRSTTMLPKGSFTGIVGSSGKTYNIVVKDPANHVDRSLDVKFQDTESSRRDFATKKGVAFEQGILLVAQDVVVDKAEESITALIYQDENGNVSNIPITVKPITSQLSGTGR